MAPSKSSIVYIVDRAKLIDLCGGADCSWLAAMNAVRGLGPLAFWWLRPDALDQLQEKQPHLVRYRRQLRLPKSLGSCTVILARQHDSFPLLRDAFLLPLCWKQRNQHSDQLPKPLCAIADLVLRQFSLPNQSWSLHLNEHTGLHSVDLSRLTDCCTWESAWASLAGGLVLAQDGIVPEDDVFASVAWDEDFGIGGVENLPAKLDVASEFGATQFFVPAENQPEALRWRRNSQSCIEIQP